MLEEFWHWLRIDVSGAARTLGFRREAAALRVRHRRCAAAWRPHLDATRRSLLRSARLSASASPSRDRAVLLGAGLLRDIPLSQILALFHEVVLADVAFHPEAQAAQREWAGRVQLARIDTSGCLEGLLALEPAGPLPTGHDDAALLALCSDAQWVASVNLLTQLPLLPGAWLRRQGYDEDQIDAFTNTLMRQHLATLSRIPGSVCIVTEKEDQVLDAQGLVLEKASRAELLAGQLPMPPWKTLETWTWQINPSGEMPDGCSETRAMITLHRDPLRRMMDFSPS